MSHPAAATDNIVPEEIQRNVPLVHRILLTEASDLDSLTLSGHPPVLETPPFDAFAASLERGGNVDRGRSHGTSSNPSVQPTTIPSSNAVGSLIKGAYRDHVVESILSQQSGTPAAQLIVELNASIRGLVPSRPDLHTVLPNDEWVLGHGAVTLQAWAASVQQAAKALVALESPARAETTASFAGQLEAQTAHLENKEGSSNDYNQQNKATIQLLVNGILYLLFKAELCQDDKNNYFLTALWAPALQTSIGFRIERLAFERRYGPLHDPATAPATRGWIQSWVQAQAPRSPSSLATWKDSLTASTQSAKHERYNLIRRAWVDDVLFRPAEAQALAIPEVLASDAGRLQGVRHITRMAAAGSTLAWLACQAAGAPASVLSLVDVNHTTDERDGTSDSRHHHQQQQHRRHDASSRRHAATNQSTVELLQRRRKVLVQLMADPRKPPLEYEQDIAQAVLDIAHIFQPNDDLSPSVVQGLRHRTQQVLQAKDPVIQLLDGRMKECFRELVVLTAPDTSTAAIPSRLQTGGAGVASSASFLSERTHMSATGSNSGGMDSRGGIHSGAGLHHTSDKHVFLAKAKALFKAKGLTFYADDLSQAARLASRIVELALKLYGDDLLDRLVREACQTLDDSTTE